MWKSCTYGLIEDLMSEDFYPPLHKLLGATNCLKKLSLDQDFLRLTDVNIHLPSSKSLDDTLANLTELELAACHGRIIHADLPEKFGKWVDKLSTPLQTLSVLRTNGVIPEDPKFPERVDEELHPKVQNILQIIEGNYSHLTTLKLDDLQLWSTSSDDSLQSISRKVIPRLSSVKIRMNQIESANMIHFLSQHPLLREIDVTVFEEFPVELLNVIMERKELNRLCIKTKRFEIDTRSTILWERLSELNNLEVFALHIVIPYRLVPNSDLLPSCVAHLPPSLKKIHLKGMENIPVWGRTYTIVTPEIFSNLNPDILTELCISKCSSSVNDDVMEFICRTFRFLRVLNISNTGHLCTDYGFTGRPLKFNSTPFSISDLRGLKRLILRSCGVITDETLIHGIKFAELCYLDVSDNRHITSEGWQAVLSHNPSLEVLKTSIDVYGRPFHNLQELKELYPRFKEHKFPDDFYSDED